MSKIRSMPKWGWFVVVVAVAGLLIPTGSAAAKAGLKFIGVQGTSGNRADVSGAGQLLTAPATPANLYSPTAVTLSTSYVAVATPPSNSALVLENLDVDVFGTSGSGLVTFQLMPAGCSGFLTNPYELHVNPPNEADGAVSVPLTPGLVIPSGDSLCAESSTANLQASVNPTGETIPAGTA